MAEEIWGTLSSKSESFLIGIVTPQLYQPTCITLWLVQGHNTLEMEDKIVKESRRLTFCIGRAIYYSSYENENQLCLYP